MFFHRILLLGVLIAFATPVFAEEWEEVFTDKKNSTNAKFYFDKNIISAGAGAVQTQYMILEPKPRPVSNSKPDGPSYDKAIYRTVIICKDYAWRFLHRAYYLGDVLQFEEKIPGDGKAPPPPEGTAPYHLSEKACALRR